MAAALGVERGAVAGAEPGGVGVEAAADLRDRHQPQRRHRRGVGVVPPVAEDPLAAAAQAEIINTDWKRTKYADNPLAEVFACDF